MQSWCLERKRTLLKMPILGTLLAFLVPPGMAALSTAYRLEQQSPVISKQDPRSQRGEKKKCYFVFDLCCMTRHVHPRSPLSRSTHLRTDQHLGKKVLILECGCVLPVWLGVPLSLPTLPFSCWADRVFRITWVAPRRGNVTWLRWGRECFFANSWLVSRRLRRNPPSGNSTTHFLSRLW